MKASGKPPSSELDPELKRWLVETSQQIRPSQEARLRVSHTLTRLRLGDTSVVPRMAISGKLYGGKASSSWLPAQLAGSGKLLGMLGAGATLVAGSYLLGSRLLSEPQPSPAAGASFAPLQNELNPGVPAQPAQADAPSPAAGELPAPSPTKEKPLPPEPEPMAPARSAALPQTAGQQPTRKGSKRNANPRSRGSEGRASSSRSGRPQKDRLHYLHLLQLADRALRQGDLKPALVLDPGDFPTKLRAEAKTLRAIGLCQSGQVRAGRELMLDVLAERPLSPYHSRLLQSCPH